MKRFKSFLKHVFFIKSRFLVPLIVLSAVLLIYIFSNNIINSPIAYLSFVLSAYTLIALCCKMPKTVKKIKGRLFSNPHSRRYLTNADLRAEISLYSGLCIHLLYSAFKLISGFHYRSLWLGTEAIYYIILSLIQFLLIKKHEKRMERISNLRMSSAPFKFSNNSYCYSNRFSKPRLYLFGNNHLCNRRLHFLQNSNINNSNR